MRPPVVQSVTVPVVSAAAAVVTFVVLLPWLSSLRPPSLSLELSSLHHFFCFCYWTLRLSACLTAGGGRYRGFDPCDCFHLYFYLNRDPYCDTENLA